MDNAIIYLKTIFLWRQDILKQSTAKYKAKFPDLGDMSHSNSLSSKDSGNTDFIWLISSVGGSVTFFSDPRLWLTDLDPTPFFIDFKDGKIFFLATYRRHIIFSVKNLIFC